MAPKTTIDLVSSLARHFALQLDLNYDALSRDKFSEELCLLGEARSFLRHAGVSVPEVVDHVLNISSKKLN
ncbi:hypothetical protein ACFMBG_17055 [Leisingera sp. D0M16]|uniref:hypothetical protein n=1 Tax=Leisingera coralii TaxID=3351347 RepID=UPI003B7B1494